MFLNIFSEKRLKLASIIASQTTVFTASGAPSGSRSRAARLPSEISTVSPQEDITSLCPEVAAEQADASSVHTEGGRKRAPDRWARSAPRRVSAIEKVTRKPAPASSPITSTPRGACRGE